ncbi:MAG: tRNA pseudouridine(38-40) synthase TruA [Parachlamydiales bacterium]|jgi:tRNA pseudouridine38-40 synthase
MPKYKLILAYDGSAYSGWQIQKNKITVQSKVEEALEVLLKKKTSLIGASRTDAGVHALGQTAHFSTLEELDLERALYSLNGLLPQDIRLKSLEPVQETFHARFWAKKKTYHYFFFLGRHQDPFERFFSTHIYQPLDLQIMQKACLCFLGRHDFSAFANASREDSAKTKPIKNMFKIELKEVRPQTYRLEFEADGFLYKMVRNLTGTLIEAASGKLSLEDLPLILASKDRKKAGFAAPAKGLFLVKVYY